MMKCRHFLGVVADSYRTPPRVDGRTCRALGRGYCLVVGHNQLDNYPPCGLHSPSCCPAVRSLWQSLINIPLAVSLTDHQESGKKENIFLMSPGIFLRPHVMFTLVTHALKTTVCCMFISLQLIILVSVCSRCDAHAWSFRTSWRASQGGRIHFDENDAPYSNNYQVLLPAKWKVSWNQVNTDYCLGFLDDLHIHDLQP